MNQSRTVTGQSEITIRLFASLRETLGQSQFKFDLSAVGAGPTVAAVRQVLIETHDNDWRALASADVRIAVNQSVVDESSSVQSGDELAFFPPVTGG
ncbi:MAG: molybdopterin converting factor subunit 1 [Pseudomonadales bacterium]